VKFFLFVGEQWFLVTILMALMYAYLLNERKKSGKVIGQHELVSLINSGEALLVDVRAANDFSQGHIQGAINIPHTKMSNRFVELEKEKSKLVVLTDQYGQHAPSVGKLLMSKGFEVRRLNGGMIEWKEQNMPVVRKK
jgi:rhodanese-related sulfurtransferase|tara:strand:+ start:49 stop:462 length:414 start_codon:yes stop_codon:yes gene_type:complete